MLEVGEVEVVIAEEVQPAKVIARIKRVETNQIFFVIEVTSYQSLYLKI
jgi:hypothetical protein